MDQVNYFSLIRNLFQNIAREKNFEYKDSRFTFGFGFGDSFTVHKLNRKVFDLNDTLKSVCEDPSEKYIIREPPNMEEIIAEQWSDLKPLVEDFLRQGRIPTVKAKGSLNYLFFEIRDGELFSSQELVYFSPSINKTNDIVLEVLEEQENYYRKLAIQEATDFHEELLKSILSY